MWKFNLPQGSLSANGPFCLTGAGQLTFTSNAGIAPFTVIYNDGVANRTVSNVSSATAFNVFTTPVTITTNYTLVSVADANCTRSTGFTGSSATITINSLPTNKTVTASVSSVCSGSSTNIIVANSLATERYQLRNNTGNVNIGSAIVGNGASLNLPTGNLTSATTFNVLANNATSLCSQQMSNSPTVSVNALPIVSNFSLAASNVGMGNFSTVTVSSSSLAAGTYTVTYNLTGANSATGNTSSITMSSNSGTFSTSTLANNGSTNVVITSIRNASNCTSNISTGNSSSFTVYSNNANLSALSLSNGTLSPNFNLSTISYTTSVANSISSITVTPTKLDANASIQVRVNGGTYASVISGSASSSLSLNVGSNTLDVKVTAQDGSTIKTYTITLSRLASNNSNLSALTISSGTLTPSFIASTFSYSVSVINSVSSVTVTPTKSDANATIQVRINNGSYTTVVSGSSSSALALNVGSNTVDAKVTAQDGTTIQTYTITVSRLAGTAQLSITAFLEGLYLGSNTMIASPFAANGTSPSIIADTIVVELHNATAPYSLAFSATGTLSINGTANLVFPAGSLGNSYYLVIKHRNSIETWSTLPIAITASTSYNFSSSISQAFGSNLSDMGNSKFAIFSGDINQDGSVDFNDYPDLDISSSNGDLGYFSFDLNGDASVDFNDYPILDINSSNGIITFTP
ncbi:MAG: cadherin-like beta sandwich domain-containing protein [Bacteroidetes bacterium]|nr:cadherin-like beta sandwich domain-containing protein [Bacteroidota bacterium]